jgi:hypothetical protein
MIKAFLMAVDFDPENPTAGQMSITDPRLYPMFAMFGALTLAVVLATIWAVRYSKKKKQRKNRHHHYSHTKTGSVGAGARAEPSAEARTRKKWRKPRRSHRPLNPTLAQTGGLPPLRDENTPLPPMP